jgi:hypothetical protein
VNVHFNTQLNPHSLGEFCGGFLGEGDCEDFTWIALATLEQQTNLGEDGAGFTGACTSDYQSGIFIRSDCLPLPWCQRIFFDGIEQWGIDPNDFIHDSGVCFFTEFFPMGQDPFQGASNSPTPMVCPKQCLDDKRYEIDEID